MYLDVEGHFIPCACVREVRYAYLTKDGNHFYRIAFKSVCESCDGVNAWTEYATCGHRETWRAVCML